MNIIKFVAIIYFTQSLLFDTNNKHNKVSINNHSYIFIAIVAKLC